MKGTITVPRQLHRALRNCCGNVPDELGKAWLAGWDGERLTPEQLLMVAYGACYASGWDDGVAFGCDPDDADTLELQLKAARSLDLAVWARWELHKLLRGGRA